MTCFDGIDPADFDSGVLDPEDDPSPDPTELTARNARWIDLGAGIRTLQFEVAATPINFQDDVTFRSSTQNDSAVGGTHFTAHSNVERTIPAGRGAVTIGVGIIKQDSQQRRMFLNISSPTNAVIVRSQARGIIPALGSPAPPQDDEDDEGDGGGVTDPATLASYSGWPRANMVVYNQVSTRNSNCVCNCNEDAGCQTYGACTGYLAAALASCHEWRHQRRKTCFNGRKLFVDGGGTLCIPCRTPCPGAFTVRVIRAYTTERPGTQGARVLGGTRFRRGLSVTTIDASTTAEKIKRIKRAIHADGAVAVESQWASKFWSGSDTASRPHFIMRDMNNSGLTGRHAYLLTGWNNNVGGTGIGCFEVHNSHGTRWGNGGRAWMPYRYLNWSTLKAYHYRVRARPNG